MVSLNGPPSPLHRIVMELRPSRLYSPQAARTELNPPLFSKRVCPTQCMPSSHVIRPSESPPMTPSFKGRQLSSVVKSMTSGRDFDSADGVEHAVPIIRAETKNVAMANGQEERSAAMPKEHGAPGLVHREVAAL